MATTAGFPVRPDRRTRARSGRRLWMVLPPGSGPRCHDNMLEPARTMTQDSPRYSGKTYARVDMDTLSCQNRTWPATASSSGRWRSIISRTCRCWCRSSTSAEVRRRASVQRPASCLHGSACTSLYGRSGYGSHVLETAGLPETGPQV